MTLTRHQTSTKSGGEPPHSKHFAPVGVRASRAERMECVRFTGAFGFTASEQVRKEQDASPARGFLLLTCEHGGNRIPPPYAPLFRGASELLATHRGWDPGALTLARTLARRLNRPLLAVTWSRLFVEANRSPTNPRIWSRFTRSLPRDERQHILERWWRPHRQAVEDAVAAALAQGHRVVHVAVHSFTPELDGEVRNADVTFLYDSRRPREAELCRHWAALLNSRNPALRLRYNYPYRGAADGLTTWLRRRHPATRYLGVELEINQALVGTRGWRRFQQQIAGSLRELLINHAQEG
ncbi:MAG: N-formylglutamate amidohydrolase [Verrucomicrobia bacterium]|nr:N-formylglutamate amidohydrolase [Verrucomicrobiota bacterium]